jgi:hypothetical protein
MPLRLRVLTTGFALALVLAVVLLPGTATGRPCWQQVVSDWHANGRLDAHYAVSCYRTALQELPKGGSPRLVAALERRVAGA